MPLSKRKLWGHPVGLYVLFLTEMWERFSYYGMRALLVLYMNSYLIEHAQTGGEVKGFATLRGALEGVFGPLGVQPLSSQIYGLYIGFVYLTPIFGGMLADRYIGQRKAVIVGALLMALGHLLMASDSLFLWALLLLILGNGFFKPSISTQVGNLYAVDDPMQDRAFTIFYMGTNLGAFFSPLVCGTLGQVYGWHYGFGAAGVGMIIGLGVYLWGQKYLAPDYLTAHAGDSEPRQPLTRAERLTVLGLVALCALNICFWAVYEQQGNTLQLFAHYDTDWRIGSWEMPSTWFQSINPAFILMAPLLIKFWDWQQKRGQEPSSIAKMAIGCCILGASFLILMFAVLDLQATYKISFLWLIGCSFVYTIGELYLSPVGMALVSKTAPRRLIGMMMGMWFLSNFFGNYLSGYLGTFYEAMPKQEFFFWLAALAVASGVAIFALQKPLKQAVGHRL